MIFETINSCVLISVYERDNLNWLQSALDSIDLEVINVVYVGVDGPIDSKIMNYLDSLNKQSFKILIFKENRGLAFVLNDLIEEALLSKYNFNFFFRMDADDINLENRFKIQKNFMLANPSIDVLGSNALIIDSKDEVIGKLIRKTKHIDMLNEFPIITPFIHPSVCFRRSVLEKNKYPINTIRNEDTSMWSNLLLNGMKFSNVNDYLIKYRLVHGTISRRTGFKKSFLEMKIRINFLSRSNNIFSYKTIVSIIVFLFKVTLPNVLLKFALDMRDKLKK